MSEVIRQLAKPIRAYHGSPHNFDRFDSSKIGAGQGMQRFGHGLYFAGREELADTYRKSLSALKRTPKEDAMELWRQHTEMSGNPRNAVGYALDHAQERLEEAAGIAEAQQRWQDIIQNLYELDYRQPLPKRPGHMYEVAINYPESALLDWDAPLSGQPEAVQKAYAGRGGSYRGMLDESGDGARLWHNVSGGSTPLGAAREMVVKGIPGIKYLDSDPRSKGTGTSNYVVFPGAEDGIRILRKYGVVAPVAAGAASQQEQQK